MAAVREELPDNVVACEPALLGLFVLGVVVATALYFTVERPLVWAAAGRARTVRAARTAAAA